MWGTFRYLPRNGADTVSISGSAIFKFYRQHRNPVQAKRLWRTARQIYIYNFLVVISNSNLLKGLIMEKLEKYLYILLLRRHIGYTICKRKFVLRFSKFKLEIGGQCRAIVCAMKTVRAPMSGQLREWEMAPVLESSGSLRKVKNAVFLV